MTEPTTANEYNSTPWKFTPLTDGVQISLQMTAYAQNVVSSGAQAGQIEPSIIETPGAVSMLDMNRFALDFATAFANHIPYDVNATNYVTADVVRGATGDVFSVRTVTPGPGYPSPGALIVLQTQDGLYWASDSSGFYHSSVEEAKAAVFGYEDVGLGSSGGWILFPTFYDHATITTAAPPLPPVPPFRSYALQFVRPTTGGGVDANNVPIPLIPAGPIMLQQVPGRPNSSVMAVILMTQVQGDVNLYPDGTRVFSPDNDTYLMIDGEMRKDPRGFANPLFNSVAPSAIPKIPISFWSELAIGSPLSAGMRLIQETGQGEVYLETDSTKRWIASPGVLQLYNFNTGSIQSVTDVELQALPSGPPLGLARDYMPYSDGTRVNDDSSGIVYLAIDGMLRRIPDPATYDNLFVAGASVGHVGSLPPDIYPIGPMITIGAYLAQDGAGKVYLMVDGVKRWIVSPAAAARFSFDLGKVQSVPAATLDISQGADINY